MDSNLVGEITPITWFCVSTLAIGAVYFKFNRLWSVRNFDLLMLPILAPALLLLEKSYITTGFAWLLAGSAYFLLRLLVDPLLVRRPMLEPNLSAGGLTFLGTALLAFLMADVVTKEASASGLEGAMRAEHLLDRRELPPQSIAGSSYGPGNALLHAVAVLPARGVSMAEAAQTEEEADDVHTAAASQAVAADSAQAAARIMAILAHMAVVIGLVLFCQQHYGNVAIGVAVAGLYLLLPYTAYSARHVNHVLPAALLVWALVAYRRPIVSGAVLGLAVGTLYFLGLLIPLWAAFYGGRGLRRFLVSFAVVLVVLGATMALTATDSASFVSQLRALATGSHWDLPAEAGGASFWADRPSVYRLPVFVGSLVLTAALVLWPPQKNLANLLAGSAAIVIVTQYWYAQAAGTYVLWYLPLLLLVVFRPNLADRLPPVIEPFRWPLRRNPASASVT